MSIFVTNDNTNVMLDDLYRYIDKPVTITFRQDDKCLICSKRSGELDVRHPRVKVYTNLVDKFTRGYLEYLQNNYRCADCKLINAEINLR